MSILRANPSLRDTRSYLASFGLKPRPTPRETRPERNVKQTAELKPLATETRPPDIAPQPRNEVVASILDPIVHRTALVKLQGPFNDRQLESISRGMVYLEKLGLLSVIVVENDQLARGDEHERAMIVEDTMRVVSALEKQGARARPVLGAVVRLGPKPGDEDCAEERD